MKGERHSFMTKLILTTIGTSIITKKLYPPKFNSEITSIEEGKRPRKYENCVKGTVTNLIDVFHNKFTNEYLSAELASLRVFKKNNELNENDVIVLLATDTVDGKFCAEVNKKVLDSLKWCKIEGPSTIKGCKTRETTPDEDIAKNFVDAGLNNLRNEVERILRSNTFDPRYFNITGGFKGIIPFATILAFEKRMSMMYLYETSSDLIIIDPPQDFYCSFEEMEDSTYTITSELGHM